LCADRIEIILRDRGIVFDPACFALAQLPTDWQTHQRGGLGLSLSRRVVDELSYARVDGVNVWEIVVRSA
jgi:anti-sigma regulatory factor (Ser/Thr protein kinase)